MENMLLKQELGVVLVENLTPKISDAEIRKLFGRLENVISVFISKNDDALDTTRYCWLNVQKPHETMKKLSGVAIAGKKLQLRLMGFFYPSFTEN